MLTLEQLTQKCENILKTLPLAHYLKVNTIPVEFDNFTETSYFDPTQFRIVVAFNNIASVIKNKKKLPNDSELENTLRCFLYHEVSHAIMTPKSLMNVAQHNCWQVLNPNFANIIEDERIETILKHYYLNVDFKKNLKEAVEMQRQITSFEHFVFNVVRFRCSPIMAEQVNKLVDQFIFRTKDITANGDCVALANQMEKLLLQLKSIYDLLPKQKAQNQQNQNGQPQENGNSSSSNSNSSKNSNNLNNEGKETESKADSSSVQEESANGQKTEQGKTDKNEESNGSDDEASRRLDSSMQLAEREQNAMEQNAKSLESNLDSKLSAEDIEKTIENQMLTNKLMAQNYGAYDLNLSDFSYEKQTEIEMIKIIARNAGFGKKQNQVQFGYGGKFNTKRFATDFNDSCKWFAKRSYENTGVNNKRNNTKVLNIWLDNSGSYQRNDEETNKILRALQVIEDKRDDFQFNLITFNHDFDEKVGQKRYSKSTGGTRINGTAKKLYKKYNPTETEFNIFLIDGGISNDMSYIENIKQVLANPNQLRPDQVAHLKQELARVESMKDKLSGYENLRSFNNKRTIFISECSNEIGIKKVAPQATLIIENDNYTGQLKRNILKAFDLLF